jgi:RNA polymerase sigma-70 factor (ECF subfamily)
VAESASLFLEHRDGVFRYLCRTVGHAETARDLTQEVFLRVTRANTRPDNPVERRAWVFRIARNLALNHLRDIRRQPAETALDVDPARRATQELAVAVRQALSRLPELDRDVFLLRESAGLSYDDIAAACEITSDGVRSRLYRARQTLREALAAPVQTQLGHGIQWKGREQP